jgi:hypothetical protein
MDQCKQCGALLPEGAKFCLQCGAEKTAEKTEDAKSFSSVPPKDLEFVQPALTGGLALGVLSAIPFVNCLCCLWVLGGGGLATWLLNKQRPGGLRYGDGALVGVVAGVVGGLVTTIIAIPIQMLTFNEATARQVQEAFNQAQMPPAFREFMEQMMAPGFSLSRTLFSLLANVVIYSLFAMVGGIIGVAIVNRKKTD